MKIITRNTVLATAALSLLFGWSTFALAQAEDTDVFTVSATVEESCHIDDTNDIDFPEYDPFTAADNSATLTVRCTNGTGYEIGLDYSGDMLHTNEENTLAYDLWQNAGHDQAWDDDVNRRGDTGDGALAGQDHTVFATVASQPTTLVGSYSEEVTVNIYFD